MRGRSDNKPFLHRPVLINHSWLLSWNCWERKEKRTMANRKMIISIGRECGSGGREIGQKIAGHYGLEIYDNNIVDIVAEKSGRDVRELQNLEEKITGKLFPGRGGYHYDKSALMRNITKSDQMYELEKGVILDLAKKESFVILGRGANAILAHNPDTVHFYIYAPESFKLPRIRERFSIASDEEARKVMRRIDKERSDYFNYYTDKTWGSSDVHDFMLDSSVLGIEGTTEVMMDLIDRCFSLERDAA